MFTLTKNKVVSLSEVSRDMGQIFFATVVIEPIVSGNSNSWVFVAGAILSIIFFGLGIILPDVARHY